MKYNKNIEYFSRFSMFLIYFWFGILKLFGTSPANDIVTNLQVKILPFISSDIFLILLGLGEMTIGILFLIPRLTKYTTIIFFAHMFSTLLPLVLLSNMTWSSFLSPTLEGQYIIKNIILIALALNILQTYLQVTKKV